MLRQNRTVILFSFVAMVLFQSSALAKPAKLHVDVGLNHFYKNRYLEAYKEFKRATEIDPNYAEAHYNLGRVYRLQGFMKEAIVEFQLAVQIKPDYTAARRELEALSSSLAEDVNQQMRIKGRDTYQKTEFDSMTASEAEKKAQEMLNKNNINEAIRYYSLVVKERPKDVSAQKMLGFLNFKANHYTDSLKNYQAAKKLAPSDSEIPYAIGLIYMKTGTPNRAEPNFKDALKLNPTMVKAYFALGEAYEAMGKLEDAAFQFQKSLELRPNLKEAKNKLDYIVGKQSYNYFSRGSYYYQRGEYDQALPLLSMAKNYGSLTAEQKRLTEEMLNASQYWVSKNQAEKKVSAEREQVLTQANISRSISPYEVSNNPNTYLNKAVEWNGTIVFIGEARGKLSFCVNSNSKFEPKSNMDFCFMVTLPKTVRRDPRISDYASVTVKGKVLKTEKIYYEGIGYSSRKQPVVEAVEVEFRREDCETPLVLRF